MMKWKSAGTGSSVLLLDTNILIWSAAGEKRLPRRVREFLEASEDALFVSAVTAWEFTELELRHRLPPGLTFTVAADGLGAQVLDLPAATWTVAATLPRLHKDPIDRMLIAHALLADLTIITSDAMMRKYPVRTFW